MVTNANLGVTLMCTTARHQRVELAPGFGRCANGLANRRLKYGDDEVKTSPARDGCQDPVAEGPDFGRAAARFKIDEPVAVVCPLHQREGLDRGPLASSAAKKGGG